MPDALPSVVGANVTVKVVFAPAFTDRAVRFVVKPVPVIAAAEMFNVALPVFVSVTVLVEVPATLTLPNATGVGLSVIVACVAVPVPVKLIASGDPGALLVIETWPVKPVAEVGANVTVKLVVCPGVKLAGALHPVSVKPAPVML